MNNRGMRPLSEDMRRYAEKRRGPLVPMNLTAVTVAENPTCDMCDGLGVVRHDVPVGHPDFGKLHMCPDPNCPIAAKIRTSRAKVVMSRAGLPGEYRNLTFNSFYDLSPDDRYGKELAAMCAFNMAKAAGSGYYYNIREAVRPLRPRDADRYEDIPKNWLVLQGDLGLGKTGLAAALVNWVGAQGFASTFYRAAEMFADIQSAYSRRDDGPDSNDVLSNIQKCDLLIIDELNMTPSADKVRIVEEIIRYRHARALPTVITCNVDGLGFKELWGVRTADVVMEMAYWVKMGGRKLRHTSEPVESF